MKFPKNTNIHSAKILIGALIVAAIVSCTLLFFLAGPFSSNGSIASGQSTYISRKIESFRGNLGGMLSEFKNDPAATAQMAPAPIEAKESKVTRNETNSKQENLLQQPTLTFAVMGDAQNFNIENEHGYFQQAASSIRRFNPDFSVSVGDLLMKCSGGRTCERDFKYWKTIAENASPRVYSVQGNHDRTGGEKADKAWQEVFDFPANGPSGLSEIAYFFDFRNSRFIFLASDDPEPHLIDQKQRSWLEKNLAGNRKENTFVFFHEPAFPVYEVPGGSLDNRVAERDAFWEIIDKYRVAGVFNGHEHIISRRKIDSTVFPRAKNSIYQFVFGNTDSFDQNLPKSGIAEFSDRGQGRFGIVKVRGREITVESHGPDGALLDTFTYQN